MIFNEVNSDVLNFYKNEGYIHLRSVDVSYFQKVKNLKKYYEDLRAVESEKAFRGPDGSARQLVNIFRDENSGAYNLYKTSVIIELINNLIKGCAVFTHAKLSFKTPFKEADWYFHQDNGYKNNLDLRSGFAIFICLEDMNEENGCLKLVPKSHLLGKLSHTRKLEHAESGDNQIYLPTLPKGYKILPIKAKQGDIIIFHSNTIHGSGSSNINSKRLSLISEVEPYSLPKFDDYGMIPILAKGEIPAYHRIILSLGKLTNPIALWFMIKKRYPKLAALIRKMRY